VDNCEGEVGRVSVIGCVDVCSRNFLQCLDVK
jgi:hypothetical protein